MTAVTYRTLCTQQLTVLVNVLYFSDISRTFTKLNIGKHAFSVAVSTICNQLSIAITSPMTTFPCPRPVYDQLNDFVLHFKDIYI